MDASRSKKSFANDNRNPGNDDCIDPTFKSTLILLPVRVASLLEVPLSIGKSNFKAQWVA